MEQRASFQCCGAKRLTYLDGKRIFGPALSGLWERIHKVRAEFGGRSISGELESDSKRWDRGVPPRRGNPTKLLWARQLSVAATIPFLLAVGPLIGYFAGKWLDGYFETEPILTYILLVFGFIASGKETWRLIKRISTDNDQS